MNNLTEINILSPVNGMGLSEGIKPGKTGYDNMFQSILNNIGMEGSNSSWVSNIYTDNNADNFTLSDHKSNLNSMNTFEGTSGRNQLNRLNKNSNDHEAVIVPSSLYNQLVEFLEKQGFSLKDINQVISASKNTNDLIELDRLLTGLSGINPNGAASGKMLMASFKENFSSFLNEQGIDPGEYGNFFSGIGAGNTALSGKINKLLTNDPKNSSFIEASKVPGAGEILFKMGVGAGDVKKIIENSLNGNRELEIGKLSAELNKVLTAPLSENDIISLLSKNNISVNMRLFNTEDTKNSRNSLLTGSGSFLTDDVQKELKHNIEAMLIEKGVSEENINSFLKDFDSALVKIKLEQGPAYREAYPLNQNRITLLEGEGKIVSGMLGNNFKEDISSFLKNKGASEGDVKSFLDSFRMDLKKTGAGQHENYLKSVLLNDKVYESVKNDQLLSSTEQGNLKLNLTELIKLADKKLNADINGKTTDDILHSGVSAKNGSAGKDSNINTMKETPFLSGFNILQEKDIKNIGKIDQPNTAMYLPPQLPKIIDRIMFMIRTGEYQSRLQITPPELGRLDIDLTYKNGHIHVNLSAENTAVKEIIEANLNQLKNQLNSQGYTIDRFDVMVGIENGERRDSETWADGNNRKGSMRHTGSRTNNNKDNLASVLTGIDIINDNQVDVHV